MLGAVVAAAHIATIRGKNRYGENYEDFDITKEIADVHSHLHLRTYSLFCFLIRKGQG
jgi:hypothetical protein